MGRWEALEGVRGWVGHCNLGMTTNVFVFGGGG